MRGTRGQTGASEVSHTGYTASLLGSRAQRYAHRERRAPNAISGSHTRARLRRSLARACVFYGIVAPAATQRAGMNAPLMDGTREREGSARTCHERDAAIERPCRPRERRLPRWRGWRSRAAAATAGEKVARDHADGQGGEHGARQRARKEFYMFSLRWWLVGLRGRHAQRYWRHVQ